VTARLTNSELNFSHAAHRWDHRSSKLISDLTLRRIFKIQNRNTETVRLDMQNRQASHNSCNVLLNKTYAEQLSNRQTQMASGHNPAWTYPTFC